MAKATGQTIDRAERIALARLSRTGLSVGDAFGQQAFFDPAMVINRELPQGRWPYTDDTAMAISIVECLDACGGIDQDDLARRFADAFASEPARGYGGMAREILIAIGAGEDWRDASTRAFGGEGSMGNGGAMRVAPVGAYFFDDYGTAAEHARKSAEITHAHPDGQAGAIAIAVSAAFATRKRLHQTETGPLELLNIALRYTPPGLTHSGIERALTIPLDAHVETAVEALGNGSQVISSDTVPFCLWCAARHIDSFTDAMWETVLGLGDRDTTCAIVGGIVAMAVGPDGIPREWLSRREPL